MTTSEYRLKNYLTKHDIHKGDDGMQTIIINSFYNQHNNIHHRFDVNDDEWEVKLKYVQKHFGLFAQYAHNEWKVAAHPPESAAHKNSATNLTE